MFRRNLFIVVMITLIITTCTISKSNAVPILDQESPAVNSSFSVYNPTQHWQQEVVVGIGGTLMGIDLYANSAGGLDFYVNRGNGWQTDVYDISLAGLYLSNAGWNAIDLSPNGFTLAAGETFVIGVIGNSDPGISIRGSYQPGLYAPGDLYIGTTVYTDRDFAFKTYMAADPVPEPTTIALLGIGIAGLAGAEVRRRRKQKAVDRS